MHVVFTKVCVIICLDESFMFDKYANKIGNYFYSTMFPFLWDLTATLGRVSKHNKQKLLTFELSSNMAVIPRVLLFIMVLKLIKRLKIFKAEGAKKALLHFTCALKGGRVAGSHDKSWLCCWKRYASCKLPAFLHMSQGEQPTPC